MRRTVPGQAVRQAGTPLAGGHTIGGPTHLPRTGKPSPGARILPPAGTPFPGRARRVAWRDGSRVGGGIGFAFCDQWAKGSEREVSPSWGGELFPLVDSGIGAYRRGGYRHLRAVALDFSRENLRETPPKRA
ncbi:hypothetical protein GCM10023259_060070 [Thermocatellispora tengchongensis]